MATCKFGDAARGHESLLIPELRDQRRIDFVVELDGERAAIRLSCRLGWGLAGQWAAGSKIGLIGSPYACGIAEAIDAGP